MNAFDFNEISKIISHALRHEPETYGLKLDAEGWVSLVDLVFGLYQKGIIIDESSIIEMVEKSSKKRHQIIGDKIRASYGHSTAEKIIKQQHLPPARLYHGTTINNIISIKKEGLLPMYRHYVHLSVDEETARLVAMRRKAEIVILEIRAQEAFNDGIAFYQESNNMWLSDLIPPKYIS